MPVTNKKQTGLARNFKDIEEALELTSNALLLLEQSGIKELVGPKSVDICARMNAQYNAMRKLLDPIKDNIKAEAIRSNNDPKWEVIIYRGEAYQANVQKITKSVIDLSAVKRFLGNKLPRFMTRREETQVNFCVKE